jgi:hypothetical protein
LYVKRIMPQDKGMKQDSVETLFSQIPNRFLMKSEYIRSTV